VAECLLQLEARVRRIHPLGSDADWAAVEVEVLEVHAHPEVIVDGDHVDPQRWRPLIYNFRHYFGLGSELGRTFRARVAAAQCETASMRARAQPLLSTRLR
jgi:flavin reductase (DIM6/NTAB) family NADH-FMN oxidoreductase RutF